MHLSETPYLFNYEILYVRNINSKLWYDSLSKKITHESRSVRNQMNHSVQFTVCYCRTSYKFWNNSSFSYNIYLVQNKCNSIMNLFLHILISESRVRLFTYCSQESSLVFENLEGNLFAFFHVSCMLHVSTVFVQHLEDFLLVFLCNVFRNINSYSHSEETHWKGIL